MAKKMGNVKKSYTIFLRNRSKEYQQYGRYLVQDLTFHDLPFRFISFLGDLSIMVLPIILWLSFFILLGAGLFPYTIYNIFSNGINILLIISILTCNTYLMSVFKGQSYGKIGLNFKVVAQDNKELNTRDLVIRQVVGIALPIIILSFFLSLFGPLLFLVINGIFVIVDSKHRSIIDVFLHTKVVKLNEKGKKTTFATPEKVKEEIIRTSDNIYDLHVYSSFSHDGFNEVEDLFKQAKALGMKALSICDHNCVKANILAERLAPLYGITYLSGINVDCVYQGKNIRILGYGINSNDERFTQIEYENLAKEKVVSQRRIELFEAFTGFKIDVDKLRNQRFHIISPEMITRQVLSNAEYRKAKLLQPYLAGVKKDKPITNFIKDFFAEGAPAYVGIAHPKAEDIIALIKSSNGVAVVAHPMKSLRNDLDILESLLSEGIVGIELFTPYHTNKDIEYLIKLVKKYHLEITAGSEYHGKNKPKFILGKTRCPKEIEKLVFKFIQKHINQ